MVPARKMRGAGMVRKFIKRAGDNADVRGSVALLDLFTYFIQYVLPVIPGIYVFWKWGTDVMFGPIIAILTALVALLAIRIAIDPDVGPRVWQWVLSRFGGAAGLPESASSPSPSSMTVPVVGKIGAPADASDLSLILARWHYLRAQLDEIGRVHGRLKELEPKTKAFLEAPPGPSGYGGHPDRKDTIYSWNQELRALDNLLRDTLGGSSPNIALLAYTPSEQPPPAHLGLGPIDADEYRRFYEQLQRLKSDGIHLIEIVRGRERTAWSKVFTAGEAAETA